MYAYMHNYFIIPQKKKKKEKSDPFLSLYIYFFILFSKDVKCL